MEEAIEGPMGDGSNELFVWPWIGVVANIPVVSQSGLWVGKSGSELKNTLAAQDFNPVRVQPLWNYKGHSGFAVVEFNKDWRGFHKAMMFEKAFESKGKGRRDFYAVEKDGGELYGWLARSDDYHSSNIVGVHLRKTRDLKSVAEIEAESKRKNEKLVVNLTDVIEVKNMKIKEIECKYNQTLMSMSDLMSQKDNMYKAYNEEILKMQQLARSTLEKIKEDHELMNKQIELRSEELAQRQREKEVEKWEARNEDDRRKLDYEKKKNEKATLEQNIAGENLLRLAEEQKSEKEKLHARILELQKKIDARHSLELEVEHMKGKIEVIGRMGEDGDLELKKKMDSLQQDLAEKEQDLEDLDSLNQALIVKERRSNDEVQQARKELIEFLTVAFSTPTFPTQPPPTKKNAVRKPWLMSLPRLRLGSSGWVILTQSHSVLQPRESIEKKLIVKLWSCVHYGMLT